MRIPRLFVLLLLVGIATIGISDQALAAGPRNPYSSFNLSGINYGAQQWDRVQREGRRVWPSYNTPARGSSRGFTLAVGGFAGAGGAVTTTDSLSEQGAA